MGGEGSGRKPDPFKQIQNQRIGHNRPIGDVGGDPLTLPDYSGVAAHQRTIDTFVLKTGDTMTGALNFTDSSNTIDRPAANQLRLGCTGTMTLLSNTISIGRNADTDVTLNFNATTNDGSFSWMEDEDYFQFADDIVLSSGETLTLANETTAGFLKNSSAGLVSGGNESLWNMNFTNATALTLTLAGAERDYMKVGDVQMSATKGLLISRACTMRGWCYLYDCTNTGGVGTILTLTVLKNGSSVYTQNLISAGIAENIEVQSASNIDVSLAEGDVVAFYLSVTGGSKSPFLDINDVILSVEFGAV